MHQPVECLDVPSCRLEQPKPPLVCALAEPAVQMVALDHLGPNTLSFIWANSCLDLSGHWTIPYLLVSTPVLPATRIPFLAPAAPMHMARHLPGSPPAIRSGSSLGLPDRRTVLNRPATREALRRHAILRVPRRAAPEDHDGAYACHLPFRVDPRPAAPYSRRALSTAAVSSPAIRRFLS